jgi:hypothetical protein
MKHFANRLILIEVVKKYAVGKIFITTNTYQKPARQDAGSVYIFN